MFQTSASKRIERKLLFVDAGVLESNQLLKNLHPDFQVIRLFAEADPILQITRSLSFFAPVNEIALLAHARPGQIDFSNYPIDRAALENHKDELYSWRNLITDDARICVYACSLAKGAIGQSFIHTLAQLTNADVASSTLPIGKIGAQSNWNLDSYTKPFQCLFPFDANSVVAYPHTLAPIFTGTEGDDTISGTNEADTINGLVGNDSLTGGSGLDIYFFETGFGHDTINEGSSGQNGGIIRFGAGIAPEDLRFIRASATDPRDLIIEVGADSIRIENFYNTTSLNASPTGYISQIEFADADPINLLEPLTFVGTAGNDTIWGDNLDSTLIGLAGDDTINDGSGSATIIGGADNDNMTGGNGLDVYFFETGFGHDTINEFSSGQNGGIIRFGAGIAPEDIRFVRDSASDPRDLIIEAGTDSIRIKNFYNTSSVNGAPTGYISQIEFADADPINLLEPLTFVGTAGNDTIWGDNLDSTLIGLAGDDTINDGSGSSTIIGGTDNDNMTGGNGLDVYFFETGFGHDTINESSSGENGGIIRFGAGIAPEPIFVNQPSQY